MRAAGALMGTELSDPVDLGGNPRSTVLRCRTAAGGSVIVKAYTGERDALRAFTSEAAGLSLGVAGPELLGVDPEYPMVVMRDLGDLPTLVDVLLGGDAGAAREGLLSWAATLGRLAAESVRHRRRFTGLRARFHKGVPGWDEEPWLAEDADGLLALLAGTGITAPDGLAADLEAIGAVSGPEFSAFTPGDTCADNVLLTPDGPVLIDFESASFAPVFLTAAYFRMPFSSCWCVFRLPGDVAAQVEDAYRAEVAEVYPPLADDGLWRPGVRRAVAAWTVNATVHLLPRSTPDRPTHRIRRPVPTLRQLLRYRWEEAGELTEYPAFAETMGLLLREVAADWDVPSLPCYPAFQPTPSPNR
ncbi:hypothetical protein Misp01_06570 [Microtetraspora sp. NBRC 13810]|nr:hypothetical protein Misp01_06570 [Microtetraspora sp. NBRC 13810]